MREKEKMFGAQEVGSSRVPPDRLRFLGKQASSLHSRNGVPLSDAVVTVLSGRSEMGPEHVRRVTEFANNYAFEDAFDKLALDHRVVDFEGGPADPAKILRNLEDSQGEQYTVQPMTRRDPFVPGTDGVEMFFGKTASKASPTGYEPANSVYQITDAFSSLTAVKEKLASDLVALTFLYDKLEDQLYKEARSVILGGRSPADVAKVVIGACENDAMSKYALMVISHRADEERLMSVPVTKTAGVYEKVNLNSKLAVFCREFTKVASQRYNYATALEDVDEKLQEIKELYRKRVLQ